jgi:hypothetical protein
METRLYYDVFQIAIVHGDQVRASVFAGRGYDVRLVCDGDDSLDTQTMKNFQVDPHTQFNFGASSLIWRASKGDILEGLSETEFEDWLWRSQSG